MEKKKKPGGFWIFVIIYAGIILLLNILARWQAFCDFYTDRLFWLASAVYSRITGIFPFSVGEILIAIFSVIVLAAIVLAVCMIFLRKKNGFMIFCRRFYKCFLVLVLSIIMVMTLNCTIPYNCSKLEINGNGGKKYSQQDVIKLRNFIVGKCSELAIRVPRDENGYVIYNGDVNDEVAQGLRAISDDYPHLGGYYPEAKPMFGSYFMYQSYTLGIYFPFTMEANYNKYIAESGKAAVIAHELAHLKGYMFENEANFIAYLACIASNDISVQYSGYLSVLYYVELDAECDSEEYLNVKISDLVNSDSETYTEETKEELENKTPVIDSDVMNSISDGFTQSYLDFYNAEANYDEVTQLLLQYYDNDSQQ